MSNGLPITYPDTMPPWLPDWPAEDDVRAMFAEGVRRLAYKALGRERLRDLRWEDRRLVGRIGDQQATWRLGPQGWQVSCTCGYPGGKCLHAYAVACMLHEVCHHEGWGLPGAQTSSSFSDSCSLFHDHSSPDPIGRTSEAVGPNPLKSARLTVEIDFRHEPGIVAVRFYLDGVGERRLLRLQSLHNYAAQVSRGRHTAIDWSATDIEFFRWLLPRLSRRGEVRANLQMLKLREVQFEEWLGRWEGEPGRFIERSSQQEFSPRGTTASHLVIELRDLGEKVQIGAVVVSPAGHRYYLHEVLRMLGRGDRDAVVGGELIRFDPPFSPDLLREVFSSKPRTTDRDNICPHLPALIGNRLDIVEGECVEKHIQARGTITLTAHTDGASILLRAGVDGVPIRPSMNVTAGHLRDDGSRFHVDIYHVSSADHVRRGLRSLAGQEKEDGDVEIPAGTDQVTRLVEFWRQLPADVHSSVDPALRPLLDDTCRLRPELSLHEDGVVLSGQVEWCCGDLRLSHEDVDRALRHGTSILRTHDGNWLSFSSADVEGARAAMRDLGIGDEGQFRVLRHEASVRMNSAMAAGSFTFTRGARSLLDRIVAETPPEPIPLSDELARVLRPYQRRGVEFLADRAVYGVGSILADDMGLGKTLQILSLLDGMAEQRRVAADSFRALVICPSSVISVWRQQCSRFCPSLRCTSYRGARESREAILTGDWEILVTNYALARIDAENLCGLTFDVVVLDEAQMIKNPDAQVTRAVKSLNSRLTLALTGTPLENRLLDFWSIMDAVNPGFLKDQQSFTAQFDSPHGYALLNQRVAPVVLRRTKEAVAPELPPRTEELITVEMTGAQQELYQRELVRARQAVREKGPVEILAALTRLRQICCHPDLILGERTETSSAKLDALCEMLAELADEGHSALVFSQFTSMLDIIRTALHEAGIRTLTITGQTPIDRRETVVSRFEESDDSMVMLLSLRAAGTGLTLTKADYVFLYDPWWNPAVEAQAIDRTHRIGQDKPIFAYRLVSEGTVEEKVLALQAEKAELFEAIMGEGEEGSAGCPRFSAEDLARLLE